MSQKIVSYNPSNGEVLGELQAADKVQISEIVQKAKTASAQWKQVGLEERLETIQRAYSAAESSLTSLAELLSKEMGKDIRRSTGEVQGTIWGGPSMTRSPHRRFSGRTTRSSSR